MKLAQLLGLRASWKHQVCRYTHCLCPRSYGSISFFRASCSWGSEGLFGQSFSVTLPIQALRGLPCLGYISGASGTKEVPCVGSYSVVLCVRHLVGQPLYCSDAHAGMRGLRGYGDGSTGYA